MAEISNKKKTYETFPILNSVKEVLTRLPRNVAVEKKLVGEAMVHAHSTSSSAATLQAESIYSKNQKFLLQDVATSHFIMSELTFKSHSYLKAIRFDIFDAILLVYGVYWTKSRKEQEVASPWKQNCGKVKLAKTENEILLWESQPKRAWISSLCVAGTGKNISKYKHT